MKIRIKFDDITMTQAEAESLARHESSRAAGVPDQHVGKQSGKVMDLVGLLGEIAFSRIFSMERDDTVSPRSGSVDFIAGNGQSVEVKSSHHSNPHLLVPSYEINGEITTKELVDIYALMRVEYNERSVTFMGWASRSEVIRPDRLQHFRGAGRLSFVVPPEEMRQLDELTASWLVLFLKAKGEIVELT
jgi:hypothetical protein